MQQGLHIGLKNILALLRKYPKREHLFLELSLEEILSAREAGWIVGTASRATHQPTGIKLLEGQVSVPSLIKRSPLGDGRFGLAIFLLDGGPLPPLPGLKAASYGRDQLCEHLWGLVFSAAVASLSLRNYLARALAQA